MNGQSIKEIPPQAAWEILKTEPVAVLIDVRDAVEYDFVGHPIGAINVPWKEAPAWRVNPDFADMVREILMSAPGSNVGIESTPLLLICRSGKRSHDAAVELMHHGFSNVYNVAEGFEGDRDGEHHRNTINGWRFRNLPWEQT